MPSTPYPVNQATTLVFDSDFIGKNVRANNIRRRPVVQGVSSRDVSDDVAKKVEIEGFPAVAIFKIAGGFHAIAACAPMGRPRSARSSRERHR